MSDTKHSASAIQMANSIKAWWEKHKFDTMGEYADRNVFDTEPEFVGMAKAVIGDWEKAKFTVKAFPCQSDYRINNSLAFHNPLAFQGTFLSLEQATATADCKAWEDFYEVIITAHGPHNFVYLEDEIVYRRFNREEADPGSALEDGAG
jgi:hypothetical protein